MTDVNIWKEEKKHFADRQMGKPICGASGHAVRRVETTKSGVTCLRCLKLLHDRKEPR